MADDQEQPLRAFGERIRKRRLRLGISQEALADLSGLHPQTVGRIERGQSNVTLMNVVVLADVLDVDPGTLTRKLKP
ncbi:MAG TPA: helix-turn-helix transcriptional regulator [Acidimicrobiales bacterium]|nr:helix-turn-helix transcriptional regulator [Acidimicrobiales bacterium]